jgi:hypothetical protein
MPWWKRLRRLVRRGASVEAKKAVADALEANEVADVRSERAKLISDAIDNHIKANHFDRMLYKNTYS